MPIVSDDAIVSEVTLEDNEEDTIVTEESIPSNDEMASEEDSLFEDETLTPDEMPIVEGQPIENEEQELPVFDDIPAEENVEDDFSFEDETLSPDEMPIVSEDAIVSEVTLEDNEEDTIATEESITSSDEMPSEEEIVPQDEELSFDFENDNLKEPDLDAINTEVDENTADELYNDLPEEISIPQSDELLVESTGSDFINSVSDTTEEESTIGELEDTAVEDAEEAIYDDIPTVDKLLEEKFEEESPAASEELSAEEESFADVDVFENNNITTSTEEVAEESEETFASAEDLIAVQLEEAPLEENETSSEEEAAPEAVTEAPVEEAVIEEAAVSPEATIEDDNEDTFAEVDNLDNNISESNLDYLTTKEKSSETEDSTTVSTDLKQDIKSVLLYMDQLLENLPEEKIIEFAKSDEFVTYKKLFNELGLS